MTSTPNSKDSSQSSPDAVLLTGIFDPRLKSYILLQIIAGTLITLVGILLLPLIPIAVFWVNKHFNALSCEMTEKFLKVRKGIFVKTEKNVPLEQITDLGIVEGPVMRFMGIKQLSVETAGQSSTGPLVKLLGITGAETFRDNVLQQRDKLRKPVLAQTQAPVEETDSTQREILATLERIESLLRARQ